MVGPFGAVVRELFLIDDEIVFLNHGSFGAAPRVVLQSQSRWREAFERSPIRFVLKSLPGGLRSAARSAATLLKVQGEDLVFVDNATTGVATAVASFRLKPGDKIATTDHVYPAVKIGLNHFAALQGATVVEAKVPFPLEDPQQVVDAVVAVLDERVKLLVIDHITSFSALTFPIEAICRIAKARGITVVVDGAHVPGQLDVDVPALGCDVFVGNLHKWAFGAKGCAVLWATKEAQGWIKPLVPSHGWDQGFTGAFDFSGTKDPSPWLSVPEAVAFIDELGAEAMRDWQRSLRAESEAILCEAWGVKPTAPASMRDAMVTVPLPFATDGLMTTAWALNDRLFDEHHIEAPIFAWGGQCWIRVAAQVYNDADQVKLLAKAVPRLG